MRSEINLKTTARADTLEQWLNCGMTCHNKGDLKQAKHYYELALALEPANATALHLMGLIHQQQDELPLAIDKMRQAIAYDPSVPLYYMALAQTLIAAKGYSQAIVTLDKLKLKEPRYPELNFELGNCYLTKKNFSKALEHYLLEVKYYPKHSSALAQVGCCYLATDNPASAAIYLKRALSIKPNFAEAWANLAASANLMKQYSLAKKYAESALNYNPMQLSAWNNLGCALLKLENYKEAESVLLQGLRYYPESYKLYENLSNAYINTKQINNAIISLKQAHVIKPDYAPVLKTLANLYWQCGCPKLSVDAYKKILIFSPNDVATMTQIGCIYSEEAKAKKAASWFKEALTIDPNCSLAAYNLGSIALANNKILTAKAYLRHAYKLSPQDPQIAAKFYYLCRQSCNWSKLKELDKKLDGFVNNALAKTIIPGETPYINVLRNENLQQHYYVARHWGRNIGKHHAKVCNYKPFREHPGIEVRVGYLFNTANADIAANLCRHHNRQRFQAYSYSYGNDFDSKAQEWLEKYSTYRNISSLTNKAAAKQIFADHVDILVDLTGPCPNNRSTICGLRPAPIQINYHGFPGTSGSEAYDYLIADHIVIPFDEEKLYLEKILYTSRCHQFVNLPPLLEKPPSRKSCGLPNDAFVYACFAPTEKIDPNSFKAWLDILAYVPNSILWLADTNEIAKYNLIHYANSCNIDAERIIFAPNTTKIKQLNRLRQANVILDTLSYNDATTTCYGLYAGIPVITKLGKHFASRVSSSILQQTSLSELICDDLEGYKTQAIQLGQTPFEYNKIRHKIVNLRRKYKLFDTNALMKELEKIYLHLLDRK